MSLRRGGTQQLSPLYIFHGSLINCRISAFDNTGFASSDITLPPAKSGEHFYHSYYITLFGMLANSIRLGLL
jgi:hypothetical protein